MQRLVMSELQKANPASAFLLSTGDKLYPPPFDSYAKGRTASQKQPETGHKGENDQSNPRSPGHHGVTCSSPREQVRARETLAVRVRAAQDRSTHLPCSPRVFCRQTTAKRSISLEPQQTICARCLSVCFPQNYKPRQKPKLALWHWSIPA